MHKNRIVVVMGATGSGKSAMALAVTQTRPTVIINADAMQMVDGLRILTARPTPEEEARAEHALYGVLPPESPTSVAVWLGLVSPVICRAWDEGKLPLLVGGTGMYIKALMDGLARIPPIPEEVRRKYRAMAISSPDALSSPSSLSSLHALLTTRDPLMAAQLKPGDTQRLLRALEVIDATGISLATWQARSSPPLFPDASFDCYATSLPRAELYARIDQRFLTMIDRGALDEARAMLARDLPPDTPIAKAHGLPELIRHLRGEISLETAVALGQQHTRNYAKRQLTWLRNQLPQAILLESDAPFAFL